MSSFKYTKAVVLSIAVLAAGYGAAESSGQTEAKPTCPHHQSVAKQDLADGCSMGGGRGMMADCQKMLERMCRDMMKEHHACHSDDNELHENEQSS